MSLPAPAPARILPTPRALITLAWPIVVSRSSQVVVGLGDALMVASLGQAELAAVTTGALNAFVAFILPMGIVFLVSSFASQLTGKGDLKGARRYGHYGVVVAGLTQVAALAALPLLGPILGLFPYAPDVRALLERYLFIRLLSAGAAVGMEALSNYYGGLGNTRLPMVVNLGVMVIDVVGNWIFIQGRYGAPRLGVDGAAWTSTISTTLGFFALWLVFLREGRRWPQNLLRLRELWRLLRFGLPSGLNWFFEFMAFNIFVNLVVAGLGTSALAAMMAVMQINSVSFMPAFALASAGSILVGQAIGAGAKDDVPGAVRLTFFFAAAWQCFVGLFYLLLPELLFSAFARGAADVPSLREAGVRMLMLSAAWQFFDAAATTLAESLRAAGDTTFTLWARVAVAWGVFAPGAYITVVHYGWGDVGAMAWVVFYIALLALVLFLRFKSGAWRKLELTEPELV